MGCGSSVPDERVRRYTSFRTQSSVAVPSDAAPFETDFEIASVISTGEEDQEPRQRQLPVSPVPPLLLSPTTHDGTLLIPHSAAGGQFRAVDSTAIMTPTVGEASSSCPTLNASLSRSFTVPHDFDSPVVTFRPGVSAPRQNNGDTPNATPPALPPVLPPDFNEYQLPSAASDDCRSLQSAGHECEEPGPLKSAVSTAVTTLKARINAPAGVTSSNDHRMLKSWDDADGGLTEVISSQRKCCERKTVHSVVLWSGELIPPVAKTEP